MPSYLILLLVITMAWNISATLSNSGVLFKKTQNISQTNWETAVSRSSVSSSHLNCAFQCVYWEGREGNCNAFKFDMENSQCVMAQVLYYYGHFIWKLTLYIVDDIPRRQLAKCRAAGDGF